jgi:uncharacterized protein YegL
MPAKQVTRLSPWHLVFVIDDSGSMSANNGAESINRAMEIMIEEMRIRSHGMKPYFKISVISFGSYSTVIAKAESEMNLNLSQITQFSGDSGSTNAAAALEDAALVLQQHPGVPTDFEPFVFFLSDGEPDDKDLALEAGKKIKQLALPAGTPRLITIGLGDGPNEIFMTTLASRTELYKHLNDPKGIIRLLPAIGSVAEERPDGAAGVEGAIANMVW